MESNHRFLGVDQVSLPLDHGAVPVKWSHRELHPGLQRAMLMSSCWTMTPKRKSWDSNPQAALAATCFQDRLLIRPDDFRTEAAEAGIEPS
jgi:hypothetical protein